MNDGNLLRPSIYLHHYALPCSPSRPPCSGRQGFSNLSCLEKNALPLVCMALRPLPSTHALLSPVRVATIGRNVLIDLMWGSPLSFAHFYHRKGVREQLLKCFNALCDRCFNENELKQWAGEPRWPLIPSSLAFKASASVMRKSLPSLMQIQEMNSKVNGVFVPMIKSWASFFMTLLMKQPLWKQKRHLSQVRTIILKYPQANYACFRWGDTQSRHF